MTESGLGAGCELAPANLRIFLTSHRSRPPLVLGCLRALNFGLLRPLSASSLIVLLRIAPVLLLPR